MGHGAQLDFVVPMVWSTGGQPIPLASSTTYATGASGTGDAILTSVIVGRLGFMVKGDHASIEAGTVFTVYVAKDRELFIRK